MVDLLQLSKSGKNRFRAAARSVRLSASASLLIFTAFGASALPAPTAEQVQAEELALRVFAAQTYATDLRRSERITYALMKAATPYCAPHRKYNLGIPPMSMTQFPADLRQGFSEWQKIDQADALRFLNVVPFSPGASAGLQEGDVLLSMIDRATGKPVAPTWGLDRPASTLVSNERINIDVERKGSKISISALPQLICDVKPRLMRTDDVVVRIQDGVLTLSTGALRFFPQDDELALLLSNEFIHYEQRMTAASTGQKRAKASGKTITRYSADEERDADYLAAYLTVSAGFSIDRAANAWKRIASAPAGAVTQELKSRHSFDAKRNFYISAVAAEIRRKTLSGERIIPEQLARLDISRRDFDSLTKAETSAASSQPADAAPSSDAALLQSLASVPFIDNEGLSGYQRFLDSPLRPRAFAIGLSTHSQRAAWSFKFGTNASANALTQCSMLAQGPCYLYAVDDKVVWNVLTAKSQPEAPLTAARSPMLTRAPAASGYASVGDLSAVPLPESRLHIYRAFLEKPAPRAFIITQKGLGRYWIGPSAMRDALAYCSRSDDNCWLYAVDDAVVWTEDPTKRISRLAQLPPANEEAGFLEK